MKSDPKTEEALAIERSTMKEAYEEIQRLANYREHELSGQMQREMDSREEGR